MHKNLFLTIFFLITFASQAQVITSKKEAIRKGVYDAPTERKQVAATAKTTKPATQKNRNKKSVLTESGGEDLILSPSENYLASQLINNAMDFIGVNYRGGGTSKAGMDCSGMVTAVFNIFGMKLPRSSHDMATVGEKLDRKEIKKGDLVFFRTNGKKSINHVGLVIEADADNDEIKFIHSSTQKGVIISSTKEPYYQRTFAQANRVL